MPTLILLNGAPGTGKSTIAHAWAEAAPGRGLVEIDRIKHSLPMWPNDEQAAGLRARELAVMGIGATLEAGDDVIVPQFLGRPEFGDLLVRLAEAVHADFRQVVLALPVDEHQARLAARAARPDREEQAENDRVLDVTQIGAMAAAIGEWTSQRGGVVTLDATGSVPEVLSRLEDSLSVM